MSRSKHQDPIPIPGGYEEGASQEAAITARKMHPQWNPREMPPTEKVASYNTKKSPMEHMKMLTVSLHAVVLYHS